MSEKKYRACLIGMLTVALVVGVMLYLKNHRTGEAPVEWTLVKHCTQTESTDKGGDLAWQVKYCI